MKKVIISVLMFMLIAAPAFAVLFDTKVLTKEELGRLSSEKLVETYKDIIIERKALETFYCKSGLTPKDFESYKGVLEFVIDIRQEMAKRQIEAPDFNGWLK